MFNAVLVLALGFALYVIGARTWPFTACRRCDGAGRFRSPKGTHWRNCPRCEGSGKKTRRASKWFRRET